MLSEKDIIAEYDGDNVWILRDKTGYYVMRAGTTHSVSDSCYALDDDGLSIAKKRAEYLARTNQAWRNK